MKRLYAFGEKLPVDLSLSENPLGCSVAVTKALERIAIKLNDYPLPNGLSLKKSLAKKFDLQVNNFFIANGSESIINDLPKIFGQTGDEVIIPKLTFPMIKICSELAGKKILLSKMTDDLAIDLNDILQLVAAQKNISLVFICNPNNPTGNVLPKKSILTLLDRIPATTLLVVDEANIEFGGESLIKEVKTRKNLIILRTFSKGFGLANLRIGFAAANPELIEKLEAATPPFQVSGLSEFLALIALEDDKFIIKTKRFVTKQRTQLKNGLEKLGCTVFPSQANNLFVKIPNRLNGESFAKALKKNGISVVLGSNFTGFDNRFFRVSVRSAKTNQLFLEKMKHMMKL